MNHTEQRKKLRALFAGNKCITPASVFDPLSARVAESVGYEYGLLSGSLVSNTTLTAPDMMLQTLTETADQIRRIMRVSKLSVWLDGDNGYGNALNVMRTIQECEHAGIAGLSIEDTVGPLPFGKSPDKQILISIEEGVGKMRAAVAARSDPSLVIGARTPALKMEGIESALARAKAYAATGVDVIFLAGGTDKLEEVKAVHDAVKLPLIVGFGTGKLSREQLATVGGRIFIQGHQVVQTVAKALKETYTHLYNGGAPADLKSKIASPDEMARLTSADSYKQWLNDFMK